MLMSWACADDHYQANSSVVSAFVRPFLRVLIFIENIISADWPQNVFANVYLFANIIIPVWNIKNCRPCTMFAYKSQTLMLAIFFNDVVKSQYILHMIIMHES